MSEETPRDQQEMQGRGFVCKNVWNRKSSIAYVHHEADGDWQFICAGDEHTTPDQAVLIHPEHIFKLFPEIDSLRNLQPGQWAKREDSESEWERGLAKGTTLT